MNERMNKRIDDLMDRMGVWMDRMDRMGVWMDRMGV
jgi:hypothetical protein